ncbi:hypothetical protein F4805DRAFT_412615 [Annulohypoxylon moriforme]|nr:hypothetical protein F4805DRAFT_412615 [Annulohypoxylon moriforme]
MMADRKPSPTSSPVEEPKPSPERMSNIPRPIGPSRPSPVNTSRPSPSTSSRPSPMPPSMRHSPLSRMSPISPPSIDFPAGPMNMNLFNDNCTPAWYSDINLGAQPGLRGGPYAIALTHIPPLIEPETPYVPLVIIALPVICNMLFLSYRFLHILTSSSSPVKLIHFILTFITHHLFLLQLRSS